MSISNLFYPNDLNLFANNIHLPGNFEQTTKTFYGPWVGDVQVPVIFSKVGNIVTVMVSDTLVSQASGQVSIIRSRSPIDIKYFPYGNFHASNAILVQDNSNFVLGRASLDDAGYFTIEVSQTYNFQATGNAGFYQFSMTYIGN